MKSNKRSEEKSFSRGEFISRTTAAAAGLTILPGYVVSGPGHISPGDKLNIAGIGIGGKGKVNLGNMKGQNIVALCDVDWDYSAPVFKQYPNAKKWKDYREMLEKQKDIDACVIAAPLSEMVVMGNLAVRLQGLKRKLL